ncbi:MAG TPA: VPLPA-CTERM sorting domain-containing protein [Tepidisphaeraceae bacterium]
MIGSQNLFAAATFAVAGVFALGSGAQAASVTINNPSFEAPVAITGSNGTTVVSDGATYDYGPTAIAGWTGTDSTGVFNPNGDTNYYTSAGLGEIDGFQVAYSNGNAITQTLSATLAANTTYTLSLEVGDRSDINNTGTTFSWGLYDSTTSTLLAGATNVTEADAFGGSALPLKGTFVDVTDSYTNGSAGVGDALEIVLSASNPQYNFDNVQLDGSSVPLPASAWSGLALLGGLATFGGFKRFRRQMA